ncbi:hypothetical protein PMAYCL1PPCAC_13121, partial [Pristionchus mayeri]
LFNLGCISGAGELGQSGLHQLPEVGIVDERGGHTSSSDREELQLSVRSHRDSVLEKRLGEHWIGCSSCGCCKNELRKP